MDNERLQRFERLAFEQMEPLYGVALHFTRNPADAEDLMQETCLRALAHFDQFTAGTDFRAWIFTILRNTRINQCKRDRVRGPMVALEKVVHVLPSRGAGGTLGTHLSFTAREIKSALARLSEEHRHVVLLAYVEGLTYREIAAVKGCALGTVMSRVYRARARLRAQLMGEEAVSPHAGSDSRRPAPPPAPIAQPFCPETG